MLNKFGISAKTVSNLISNGRHWKWHSKLVRVNKNTCTYINRSKKYPYNSTKRGWLTP